MVKESSGKFSVLLNISSMAVVLGALIWLGERNYLMFHSLVELFGIIVTAAIFLIVWNVRDTIDNGYLQFLGIALLFVATIDLIHTLAYKGMGVFPGYGTDIPTQLWIAGRTMEALSLLMAPMFLSHRVRPQIIFASFLAILALLLLSIFRWSLFPACYVEGQGLTQFKVTAEYAICFILVLALIRLLRIRHSFQDSILILLCISIATTILSELAFTKYASVYGNSNLIGHLLKIISVVFIYKAIVETGFRRPYDLLYRSLAESERKFRSTIESNMIGVVFADPITGAVTEANDEYLRIVGRSRADLKAGAINWKAMTPAETLVREEAEIRNLVPGRTNISSFEKEYIRPDGTHVPVIIGGTFLDDTKHRMVAYVLDNTARKQAEQELRSSEEKFTKAFSGNPAAIAITRLNDGLFLDVNETWLQLNGYTQEEIIGRYARTMNIWPDLESANRFVNELKAKGTLRGWEQEFYKKSGEVFIAQLSAQVLTVRGEAFILSTMVDITDLKRAEQSLRDSEEQLRFANDILEKRVKERTAELGHRALQLRQLATDLTLSEQRERQRLAMVLHDGLQQLLVAAKLRIALLERAGDLHRAIADVSDLIDDSITTSRSLTAELSPPILYQGGLVPGIEWLANWMHEKHRLSVNLVVRKQIGSLPEELTILLFQALRELLFNIVKHAGVKAARVEITRLNGLVQLEVIDNGVGFDVKKIYFQEENSGGMGLFSINERLSHLGGRMEAESAPGQGSRFRLITPQLDNEAESRGSQISAQHSISIGIAIPESANAKSGKIRTILVDDHLVMRQGLASLLRVEPDIEIAGEASDGESAIDIVRQMQPDVVLMDIGLPKMDGIETTRIIHKEFPSIGIIGLSMFQEEDQATAILQAGALKYITKTGPSEAVIEAIRFCAGKRFQPSARASSLEIVS
jgi:PAS domain S-box-containing protein